MDSAERLYNLLPAIYRSTDAERGEQLRALLAIIDRERQRLEDDIGRLYADQFIETCQPWVVPYIAELLDVRLPEALINPRAFVANTLRHRRRKGVLRTFEALAWDVAGWRAVAVEFFEHLACAQHVDHPRPERTGFASVRDEARMERNGTPFERAPRTAEVRMVDTGRGKYGVSNVGLYVWRTQDYPLARVRPRPFDPADAGLAETPGEHRFHFHPVGKDVALVNPARSRKDRSRLTDERDVPAPLRNRRLYRELEARRGNGSLPTPTYFEGAAPAFSVRDGGDVVPVEDLYVCSLEGWKTPQFDASVEPRYIVDPGLGRLLVLSESVEPNDITVDYAYAGLADIASGPYDRGDSVASWIDEIGDVDWQFGVSRTKAGDDKVVGTLEEALAEWTNFATTNASQADAEGDQPVFGVITIMDSDSYAAQQGGSFEVEVPAGHRLAVVAAEWHKQRPADQGPLKRIDGEFEATDVRPHVAGDWNVTRADISGLDEDEPGELIIDGLLIEGQIQVTEGALEKLRVLHTTLVPEDGGVDVTAARDADDADAREPLDLDIAASITGPIVASDVPVRLSVRDSVVTDAEGDRAIDGDRLELIAARTSVLGEIDVERLEADDSIFAGRVQVARRQDGCVRFCYAPTESTLPRKYRCQPFGALEEAGLAEADPDDARRQALETRVRPRFVSHDWWRPNFAQLTRACAAEIAAGAEDGSEMGVYSHLLQPQRLAAVRAAIAEHVRVGMYAGIFFVT